MEEELRALLLSHAPITDIVANRIDWGVNTQGALFPRVVLTVISSAEGIVMNGSNNLEQSRVQVDCYAMTYGQCKSLSRAIINFLHVYRGGGFRLITHESVRDSRESGTNEAERPFRVSLDFLTAWRA
ncbi:MAG: DUF3168 domain-containing protein [Ahrensia sp.]|nr:DUF3168 domain-containing protein [Ahrensia sp.]